MSIAKVRAWLLARPEPRQPMRRIVPLGVWAAAVTFLAVVVGPIPSLRVALSRLLWLVITALGAGVIVLFVYVQERGRKARRARG